MGTEVSTTHKHTSQITGPSPAPHRLTWFSPTFPLLFGLFGDRASVEGCGTPTIPCLGKHHFWHLQQKSQHMLIPKAKQNSVSILKRVQSSEPYFRSLAKIPPLFKLKMRYVKNEKSNQPTKINDNNSNKYITFSIYCFPFLSSLPTSPMSVSSPRFQHSQCPPTATRLAAQQGGGNETILRQSWIVLLFPGLLGCKLIKLIKQNQIIQGCV